MAIADTNIASGQNADTSLNTIYTVSSATLRGATIYSMLLTNTTSNIITVDIYVNDGTDRLVKTVKIPAGSGNTVSPPQMVGVTLEQNQSIKIQAASADAFNYKLNGNERT